MKPVLVTGANGYIGRAVVQRLLERGCCVTALVRHPVGGWPAGVTPWVVADIEDLGPNAGERLAAVQSVIHCAARVHVMHETAADPLAEFRRVNVRGSVNLAQAAAAAGVQRFVFVSSIGVNGDASPAQPFRHDDVPCPTTPYAQSKWEAEQALQALAGRNGMTLAVIRPPLVYGRDAPGNFALLVRAVASGLPLPLGALRAMRSFVSLDNLADLLAQAATVEPAVAGTYLASDDEDLSTAAFVRAIAVALGRRPWLVPLPERALVALAGLAGRGDQIRKMAVRLQVDVAATRRAFDWAPRFSVAQSMQRALEPHNAQAKGVSTS